MNLAILLIYEADVKITWYREYKLWLARHVSDANWKVSLDYLTRGLTRREDKILLKIIISSWQLVITSWQLLMVMVSYRD